MRTFWEFHGSKKNLMKTFWEQKYFDWLFMGTRGI
jgi:hypothetical protein